MVPRCSARVASEQADVVVPLQGLQVIGHGRLGDMQALGRRGHAADAHHHVEDPQLNQVHGAGVFMGRRRKLSEASTTCKSIP